MSKMKDMEQQPSCQHFENDQIKQEVVHVTVSEERQSFIKKKVSNIGNAKTVGLQEDLHLDSYQWSWVLYSFYICYIIFEWTTVLWKILPAHLFIAGLCIWYVRCAFERHS
ncbi:hypothetical protein N7540_012964 [Penicillium herquei]|nr:hypothetical protein N7540_012964 [Penicillium herquei]